MAEGGKKLLLDGFINGQISGVIGLVGANGTRRAKAAVVPTYPMWGRE